MKLCLLLAGSQLHLPVLGMHRPRFEHTAERWAWSVLTASSNHARPLGQSAHSQAMPAVGVRGQGTPHRLQVWIAMQSIRKVNVLISILMLRLFALDK
jgi:hypothetical protein